MKYYSIIITLALISCLIVIFWPKEPSKDESKLIDQRDDALVMADRKQKSYDSLSVIKSKIEARLIVSEAAVQRSEQALTKSEANAKVYLKRIKEQSLKMTDIQADSAIMHRYQSDPDSIPQKVYADLAKLDTCDSLQQSYDTLTRSYRNALSKADSLFLDQQKMLQLSRDQISNLYSALDKDNKIIEVKDKHVRRLRRQNKVLKIAAPILFIVGVLVAL